MSVLVISPHLDDAVLSVPAWIAARVAAGAQVSVLTVFSEGGPDHAQRRAEDHEALALLGARTLHMGLLDAPWRRGLRIDYSDLVLGELAADDPDAARVVAALHEQIGRLAPSEVLLPLGVGEHIDHRIVHAAHAGLAGRVGFYADRPYAGLRHAVRARLARLGASVDGELIPASRLAADELLAAAEQSPHIRAYVPAHEREAWLRPLAAPLAEPAPASGLHLRGEPHRFDAALRERAVRAVRAYASQIAELMGSADALADAFAEPYVEHIFWRCPA